MLGLLLWLFVWGVAGVVCAMDAERRGKPIVLVFLLVIIGGPIGLINWILFRPEDR